MTYLHFAITATALCAAFPLIAQTSSLKEGFADLPGVRLFYVDSGGSGQPVVFLHAATGTVPMWENQVKAFTSAGYRFIAYDRRGWGKSTVDPKGPQPGTGADDLQALVDYLKLDRFHLVGTAAGAFIAVDYALAFPQRVRSLTIACTIGGIQDEEYQKFGQWLRPSPTFEALPSEMKELGPSYRAANRKGTERWIAFEQASRPPGPRAPAQTMKNKLTYAALETLHAPTLAIAGGADLYAPPGVMQMFTSHIKGAKLVTVPDSGHSTYWEYPGVFNRTILDFLRRAK